MPCNQCDLLENLCPGCSLPNETTALTAIAQVLCCIQTAIEQGGGGGGGGMTSFNVAGNTGPVQNITNANTLAILGAGLLNTVASATDTITVNLTPGANGTFLQTVAGAPAWAPLTSLPTGIGVGGPATPGKAFTVNGDLDVTGVIDPTKIIFSDGTPSSFNPALLDQYEIEYGARKLVFKSGTVDALHLRANGDVRLNQYPNTRIDTGAPINVLSTDVNGVVRSYPVGALPSGGITSLLLAGQIGPVQTLTDGNTISILPGNGGIATAAAATDTVNISVVANPAATNPVIVGPGGVNFDYSKFDFSQVVITTPTPAQCAALATCGFGGGGMTSFALAGATGTPQTIVNGDTVRILPLDASITTVGSATDTVNVGVVVDPAPTNPVVIGSSGVTFNYTKFDFSQVNIISFTPAQCELIQDCVGGLFNPGGGLVYNDILNTVTVAISSAPGNGLVQNVDGLFAPSTSGLMTSFTVAGDTGTPQIISNGNTLTLDGQGVVQTVAVASDTVQIAITPGTNGHVLTTVAGVPTWAAPVGGGLSTASNGLTAVGSDVRLGGTLNTNTGIEMAGNRLRFTQSSSINTLTIEPVSNGALSSTYYEATLPQYPYQGGTLADGVMMASELGTLRRARRYDVAKRRVDIFTASGPILADMQHIVANSSLGNITLSLPGASPTVFFTNVNSFGNVVTIKRRGAGLVTINAPGLGDIDGAASIVLPADLSSVVLQAVSLNSYEIVARI